MARGVVQLARGGMLMLSAYISWHWHGGNGAWCAASIRLWHFVYQRDVAAGRRDTLITLTPRTRYRLRGICAYLLGINISPQIEEGDGDRLSPSYRMKASGEGGNGRGEQWG